MRSVRGLRIPRASDTMARPMRQRTSFKGARQFCVFSVPSVKHAITMKSNLAKASWSSRLSGSQAGCFSTTPAKSHAQIRVGGEESERREREEGKRGGKSE